ETFVVDGRDFVTRLLEKLPDAPAEVLVELDLQEVLTSGTSTYRSRAISAPYAMQARMSASSRPGWSLRISSALIPPASKSRIRDTQILCPRMQGFPKHTPGSIVILERSSSRVMVAYPNRILRLTEMPGAREAEPRLDRPRRRALRDQG